MTRWRPADDPGPAEGLRAPEVVVVGSASRDLVRDDPRGWRLGGGVSYAALASARLGVRTAAVIGLDPQAWDAHELDLLDRAGVALLRVPLPHGPVFRNVEAGGRRRQTCLDPGAPLTPLALPPDWADAAAWILAPVAAELPDAWSEAIGGNAFMALGWQGLLRTLRAGAPVKRRRPAAGRAGRPGRPGCAQRARCHARHPAGGSRPVPEAGRVAGPDGRLPRRDLGPGDDRRPGRSGALPGVRRRGRGGRDGRRRHVPRSPGGRPDPRQPGRPRAPAAGSAPPAIPGSPRTSPSPPPPRRSPWRDQGCRGCRTWRPSGVGSGARPLSCWRSPHPRRRSRRRRPGSRRSQGQGR